MRLLKGMFVVAMFMVSSLAQSQVPDAGYYWWGNKAYFDASGLYDLCIDWNTSTMDCDHPTLWVSYGDLLASAGAEYDDNTQIDAGQGPNGEGKVEFINIDYPLAAAAAATMPFYGTTPCAALNGNYEMETNGNCNYSSARPNSAKIYFNDHVLDDRNNPGNAYGLFINYGDVIVRHELGHVLGLAHNDSGLSTFMKTNPGTTPETLHTLEIIWINGIY